MSRKYGIKNYRKTREWQPGYHFFAKYTTLLYKWFRNLCTSMFRKLLITNDASTTILIRLMTGGVFLSEGIQKFLFPAARGAGRFEKIGLPAPEFLGAVVGTFEIVCGALLLAGLLTRLASIPLMIIMLTAIATTKVKLVAQAGFWEMLHESRTDWAMLLGCFFLLFKGGGRWSVDLWLCKNSFRGKRNHQEKRS